MTVLSTVSFNGLSEGATINTAALPTDWTASGSAFTATAASAIHGARGARIDNVTSGFVYYETSLTSADRVMSGYFKMIDNPANSYLAQVTSSGTNRADWRINSNGTVTIRNATVAVATSSATLSTGVVYRWEWLTGTGGQELRIYLREGSTPVLTLTGAVTNASRNRFAFGVTASGGSRDFEMDTLRVADAWTGAFVAPETIAVTTSVVSTATVAPRRLVEAAVTVAAASSCSVAARARRRGSVTWATSSGVSVAPRARRRGAVTFAAVTTVAVAPTFAQRVYEIAVTIAATSAAAFAARRRRKASVTVPVVSTTSVAPRGRFRAAFTVTPAVTVGFAPRLRARVAMLVAAVTSVVVDASARFLSWFTVPVVSGSSIAVYLPAPPAPDDPVMLLEVAARVLTVEVPEHVMTVSVPSRVMEIA